MRELLLASRGLEIPIALREKPSYAHHEELDLSPFFARLRVRPPSGRVRLLVAPAFALPENVEKGIYWAVTSFDPAHPTPEELTGLKRPDRIWVPSEHHAAACRQNGLVAEKVMVLPPAVNGKIFHPRAHPPSFLNPGMILPAPGRAPVPAWPPPGEFLFVAVASPLFRKGVDLLLRAYLEEFKAGEPVRLVLKLTHLPKLKKQFPYEIGDLGKRLGALNRMFPSVTILADVCSDLDLAGIMASANAFVCANRAFSTALPAWEALSCGLPIIGPEPLRKIMGLTPDDGHWVPTRIAQAAAGELFPDAPAGPVDEPELAALRRRLREVFQHGPANRKKADALRRRFTPLLDWAERVGRLRQAVLPLGWVPETSGDGAVAGHGGVPAKPATADPSVGHPKHSPTGPLGEEGSRNGKAPLPTPPETSSTESRAEGENPPAPVVPSPSDTPEE